MRRLAVALLLPLLTRMASGQDSTLSVLRHFPDDSASPANVIRILFDRPVAGRLDATIPAARLLTIEPAIAGQASWRDPITLEFLPAAPLPPGTRYAVTVSNGFQAIDGSRLPRPYRFEFAVPGPRLIAKSIGSESSYPQWELPASGKVLLLYSASVDPEHLRLARLELTACGGGPVTIAMRAVRERPVERTDPYPIQSSRGGARDTVGDEYRRVVELEPEHVPPEGCYGQFVLPTVGDDVRFGAAERYGITTIAPFALARFGCAERERCPLENTDIVFNAPVTREALLQHVHLMPAQPLVLDERWGPQRVGAHWTVRVKLAPAQKYQLLIDSALRDSSGRPFIGPYSSTYVTGDLAPALGYARGTITVRRSGPHTIPLRHVNVREVRLTVYRIPEAWRARVLARSMYGWIDAPQLDSIAGPPERSVIALSGDLNVEQLTELPLPTDASGRLIALRFDIASERSTAPAGHAPAALPLAATEYGWRGSRFAFIQYTDLALTTKIGPDGQLALVTGLADGLPREGVRVNYLDALGAVIASGSTDRGGLARLAPAESRADAASTSPAAKKTIPCCIPDVESVEAIAGDDRVTQSLMNRVIGFESDGLYPARLAGRMGDVPPAAAALFADRGIYRPGEMLYLKGIVREGALGALAPAAQRRVRLTLSWNDEYGVPWINHSDILDTVLVTSDFGTVADSLRLRGAAPVGRYTAELAVDVRDRWVTVATDSLRIAEYRAPEFLVHATTGIEPRFGGDTLRIATEARYLFGAPMGRAPAAWSAELRELYPWEIHIPGAEGWEVGEWDWTRWQGGADAEPSTFHGDALLDASGRATLEVPIAGLRPQRPGQLTVRVAVFDVNQQVVSSTVQVAVHPARRYVLARKRANGWWWSVGQDAPMEVRVVTPDGTGLHGVPVTARVVRRSLYYGTPDSTLRTDTVTAGEGTTPYAFRPMEGGYYEIQFSAVDERGDTARTLITGFAFGGHGWWGRAPEHLALGASAHGASPGDTLSVAFDSPFDSADAWVTLERETVLAQFRMPVKRGANVIPLRMEMPYVPNVFVGVMLVRRGELGARPDSATQLFRAGYTEIAVSDSAKRLSVTIAPRSAEYRPGDTATLAIRLGDRAGRGVHGEVTLWAVDEGVLSLTGYSTPDILASIFEPRPLGSRLWTTLASVLTNDPGLSISLAPRSVRLGEVVVTGEGVSYAGDAAEALRSDFRSTAFYLAAVRTDSGGAATVRARLPDNITTYRVMAVAVDSTDRFGTGVSPLIATRPLVARPALPRFVRPGDTLLAATVVNARDGAAHQASVEIRTTGMTVLGTPRTKVTLAAGRGGEATFRAAAPARESGVDTAIVTFRVAADSMTDAVRTRVPVRPDFHTRTHTWLGILRNETHLVVEVPRDIDPARSRLRFRVGTSPLAPMLASYEWLRAYPYDCTEQIASSGRALIAVWHATHRRDSTVVSGDQKDRLQALADELVRRQGTAGSFQYWRDNEWSSPWLTAYAGLFLLEARAEGIDVDSSVLRRAADYLRDTLRSTAPTGGMNRYEQRVRRLALGDRVAAVEYLRRAGAPDLHVEDDLLALAPMMTWEDRLRLAEVLAGRSDAREAARSLVDAAWRATATVGGRIDLPDSAHTERQFPSHVAPAARLLTATLALGVEEPRLAGLIETILVVGRAEGGWAWSTQDYASAVMAMAAVQRAETPPGQIRMLAHSRQWFVEMNSAVDSTVAVPLTGLIERSADGRVWLKLHLATGGSGFNFYALSVDEVPSRAPVTPDASGLLVERWYERLDNGRRVTSVRAGDLVRVRLRVTVPADRVFVALEDPLPAGFEVVDVALRTASTMQPFVELDRPEYRYSLESDRAERGPHWQSWLYGSWDGGWWSPWDHREYRDDRVVLFARMLWKGTYDASYIARATTAGDFTRPPAHAEEMYDPAVEGRSDGGRFEIVMRRTE